MKKQVPLRNCEGMSCVLQEKNGCSQTEFGANHGFSFHFYFLLLLSAQFVDIHEIQGDAPVVATYEDSKHKKEPLNLVLEIANDTIDIKIGLMGVPIKIPFDDRLSQLHTVLTELKAREY